MLENEKQQPLIQSVSRASAILKCFGSNTGLGLSEIARMVGLHKSTAAGIINTLKAEGFLEQDERTGKLRLGLSLFSLAVQSRRDMAEICDPYLNELLNLTGETVNLAVLDKTEVVYIAKKESLHSIRISTSVGTRLPVYCTAMGKAMLAAMDRAKAEALIDSIELIPRTSKTIVEKNKLLEDIDAIKRDGVAYDLEEFEPGVICVSSSLRYTDHDPIGAISVSGPYIRIDDETRKTITGYVNQIANKICNELARLA